MKKILWMSAVCVVTIALFAAAPLRPQGRGGRGGADGAQLPELPFHLVPGFFHYPPYYVIGRASGITVDLKGNILALNRGPHPVIEFKPDGTFLRSWGEGSTMFAGAHVLRVDPQGNVWYVDAA